VQKVIDTLKNKLPVNEIKELAGIEEHMSFSMPRELRDVKIQHYFTSAEKKISTK